MNKPLRHAAAEPRPRPRPKDRARQVAEDTAAEPLRGHAPLVPIEASARRALIAVIAILTFLAAACAMAVDLVEANAARWRAAVAREATIQVRPSPHRNMEADLAKAAELARQTPGIEAVAVVSPADAERMLEPWLGSGLDLGALPVPRLIAVTLAEGARPDLDELRRQLAREVPVATLDGHGAWLTRLSAMAGAVVLGGIAVMVLVLAAAALAVAFATQGAVAGNRELVEVLHYVGATNGFIASQFQRRFFRLGLVGGAAGAALAIAAIAALALAAAAWGADAAADQIEAMFGRLEIHWRGLSAACGLALLVATVAALVARFMVKRFLRRSP
jgi:cell division transport system permease protein